MVCDIIIIYKCTGENDKMHLLIANDDGIFAPGIRALSTEAVRAGHRVTVFAPETQRSAASHALTIARALRAEPVEYGGIRAYSVNGTPADCVRLGLFLLGEDRPDCVLTGINNGPNRGAAILYSGTVASAMEGSLCGVPGVAVSLCTLLDRDFEVAARLGVKTAEWAVAHPLPRGEIYNLNVPYGVPVLGIRAASVSNEYIFSPMYEENAEGYWMARGADIVPETEPDSDLLLTEAGYASLSVIGWNLMSDTPVPDLRELEAKFEEDEHGTRD